MLDFASALAGTELHGWGGRQRFSGEAEPIRRHPATSAARLNGGAAEGAKGPLSGGRDNTHHATQFDRPFHRRQLHRSDICPDLRGGFSDVYAIECATPGKMCIRG